MKAYSTYHVRSENKTDKIVMIVTDSNPEGVTITIKDNAEGGEMVSFNLPRIPMIEALEYILAKIKTSVHQDK